MQVRETKRLKTILVRPLNAYIKSIEFSNKLIDCMYLCRRFLAGCQQAANYLIFLSGIAPSAPQGSMQ